MEKKTFYLTCERTWVYDTLIFAAGILGSYTYMLCGGIFCNAQTGNIVLLGIALGTRSWTSALYYVIPISAYALGAFISELIPDDVKRLTLPLLRHRIVMTPAADIEGLREDDALREIVDQTAAPR